MSRRRGPTVARPGGKVPSARPSHAIDREAGRAGRGPLHAVLALQQTAGNRAVGHLLAPRTADGAAGVADVLSSGGRPLDPSLRAVMQMRLGADLGAVRVHDDAAAAASARSLQAKAYTVGHHVAFGAGRFAPETAAGERLLAHELTHVVQQGAGSFPAPAPALASPALHPAGTPAEREAEGMASGQSGAGISHAVRPGTIMRAPEGEGEGKGTFDTIVGGLIGDFREDPSLAEIGINTGVSLIPVVGEVTAARDVTANVYYMVKKEEYTSPGRWLGLVLALVALFPEIGAALKGLGKAVLKGAAEALGPIVRLMERVLEKLGRSEGLRAFFLKNWEAIVTKGTAVFEKALARLSSLLTRAVRFVSSKAEAFSRGLDRIREIAARALPEAFEKVKNLIAGVLDRFASNEEGAAAKEAGKLAQSEQRVVKGAEAGAATGKFAELPRSQPIPLSVGAMSRAEALARKLKLNINSPTTRQLLNSLDDTVEHFISQFRKSSILKEFPGEYLKLTVEEALESGNSTVRKLLIDGRFAK